LAGKLVEVRQPIGYNVIELRFFGQLMALHFVAPPGSPPQWLPEHKADAEAIVLGRRRLGVLGDGPVVTGHGAPTTVDLDEGDYDVATPDLAAMAAIGPAPDLQCFGDNATEGTTADGIERDGGAS
jgi:hypothetical protein